MVLGWARKTRARVIPQVPFFMTGQYLLPRKILFTPMLGFLLLDSACALPFSLMVAVPRKSEGPNWHPTVQCGNALILHLTQRGTLLWNQGQHSRLSPSGSCWPYPFKRSRVSNYSQQAPWAAYIQCFLCTCSYLWHPTACLQGALYWDTIRRHWNLHSCQELVGCLQCLLATILEDLTPSYWL